MTAPVGRVVYLYMDTPRILEEGACIVTDSGRSYRIVGVRRQERGKWRGRWHLQCLVIDPATVTDEDEVIRLVWYARVPRATR